MENESKTTLNPPGTSTTPNTEQILSSIVDQLSRLNVGVTSLVHENNNRKDEIITLGRKLGLNPTEETDNESENASHNESHFGDNESQSDVQQQANRINNQKIMQNQNLRKIAAKDIIRTIKTLTGQDDCGVEDFIKNVKRAKGQCYQPDLLLDFIISEKITGNAERAIRYLDLDSYAKLFNALRANLTQIGSVSMLRSKLLNCKQNLTEDIQSFNNKYRKICHELKYAIQSEYTNTIKRQVAIENEESEILKRYMMNIRRDIGLQIKAQRPLNLNEAQMQALELELWFQESDYQNLSNKINAPAVHVPTQIKQVSCYKCGKTGHMTKECTTSANFRDGRLPKRPPEVIRVTREDQEFSDFQVMTEEEMQHHEQYEKNVEYQPCVDD
ncbi:uncharacterized protein LOC122506621 [Leptopilina heterotoma]|uniref:uncharacterized protein LOC122506621 n=1 Tax=Leptopilina heterotoma TaxID=63436 RepID=UPI001CA89E6A|nr:uncharacterized protein LOC122506621 [Leptopilina heterotoma]